MIFSNKRSSLDRYKDNTGAPLKVQTPAQIQARGPSEPTERKAQPTKTDSGFQNIDAYFQNNTSKPFAQQVAGNVQGDINQATQNQQQAKQTFEQQVDQQNTTPTEEQVNTQIDNAVNATEDQQKEFQKWLSQYYQGDKSLAENQKLWNDYWSGTNKAQTTSKLLGSEPGRFALLDQYFGRPSYSFGEKALDNSLLQRGGIGRDARTLRNEAAELKSQGNQGALDMQNYTLNKAKEVEEARKMTRNAIGIDDDGKVITGDDAGAIGSAWADIDNAVKSQNTERKTYVDNLMARIRSGQLTKQDLADLGLTEGMSLYDVDLSSPDFYDIAPELTRNNVMSPEQQARIRALSDLAGIEDTYASGDLKSAPKALNYKIAKLQDAIKGREAAYQAALRDTPISVAGQNFTLKTLADQIQAIHYKAHHQYDDIIQTDQDGNVIPSPVEYSNEELAFLRQAEPALEKAKKQVGYQFNINRTLKTIPDGALGIGGGIPYEPYM